MQSDRPLSMRLRIAAPVLAALSLLPDLASTPYSTPTASPVSESGLLPVELIAALTGPNEHSTNSTDEAYGVYGTGLGHTFMHGADMYMIFGDTFGINRTNWRSNAAAVVSTDQNPSDGLIFDRMITD